jgi:hypothetical protein
MKHLLLLSAAVMLGASAYAQPWLKDIDITKPVKLQDVVSAYERQQTGAGDDHEKDEKGDLKEGKNYHFSRWVSYWERHLDENGNLVSPLQNWMATRKHNEQHTGNKTTAVDQSQWQFAGPDKFTGTGNNGVGRINVVTFHPTDSNTFWIGSAGGGAWKTSNGGLNWTIISNYLPVLGVSDIDFNPINPNTVYMCTGDRDAKDNFSVGVLKSYDGGTTWDTTGLKWPTSAMMLTNWLEINPLDTNSITLAASSGMHKSYNGGATWSKTITGDFRQVLYHPTDTNILYAATMTNIFHSTDGGATWQPATTFTFTANRIMMSISAAAPNVLKAVAGNASYGLEGIYRSDDTAKTFVKIFDDSTNCSDNILASSPKGNACGGQAWYDLSFAISPTDTNMIVVGGVNTWLSNNGGYGWTLSNQWNNSQPGIQVIHADKHFHTYNPIAPTALYECNDGGIFRTYAPASNLWTNLTDGLGITQFYRNAVSDNANFVIGGSQDNGTKRITGTAYAQLAGGDGMDCQIDYTDSKVFYVSQQYGELKRTTNNGSSFTDISNNIPGGQPNGAWITPIVIDPQNPYTIYAGYTRLYKSTNRGTTWTAISNTFGGNANRIAISPNNTNRIFVLANNTIYYTLDGGGTWKTRSRPYQGNISDIQIQPRNERLWITFNGYGSSKVAEYDSIFGWTPRNEQLPDVPVNCIAFDTSNHTIYIGTDIGVFYRDDNVIEWVPFDNGLPVVEVTDLGINYATNEIWAATYGRSMWKSKKHDPSQTTDIHSIPLSNGLVTVSPNPNKGQFTINTENKLLIGKKVTVRIVNMTGATVWNNAIMLDNAGRASVNTDLAPGSYIIDILSENMRFAREKIVVQ